MLAYIPYNYLQERFKGLIVCALCVIFDYNLASRLLVKSMATASNPASLFGYQVCTDFLSFSP